MRIEKLDNQGRGIIYVDNKITFVNNALPNEDVEIEITEKNKKYNLAKVIKRNNSSDKRVEPICPFYSTCGGCNLMHMDSSLQDEFKRDKVKDILKRFANLDIDVEFIENKNKLNYRNKITLKVVDKKIGYYKEDTHEVVSIDKCLLASNAINKIVNNLSFINIKDGEIVIKSNYKDEILISIKGEASLNDNIPSNVIGIVINDKTIYKDNYIIDKINESVYKISYNSFFQVNNYIAGKIIDILNDNLSGDNLLDLYCGVGTLGIGLKDKFKSIYGIEIVENAIINAKENAKSNNINNAIYLCGNTDKLIDDLKVSFDTVLVDPPRSGLSKHTLEVIKKINPKTLAYVSCDPITLARDLKNLSDIYKVNKVYACDMFTNTYHVESITILERR